jgi:hypothetical protein
MREAFWQVIRAAATPLLAMRHQDGERQAGIIDIKLC